MTCHGNERSGETAGNQKQRYIGRRTDEPLLPQSQEVLKQLIAEKKKIEAQIEASKAAEIIGSLGDVTGVRTTDLEYTQYGAYSASDDEVKALATLIYCEAGNQGAEGQLAVGAVVMNRIRDPRFSQGDIMSVIPVSYTHLTLPTIA